MSGNGYRPVLDDETVEELEKTKNHLKSLEEEDFPDRDKPSILWRRGNGTFDLNWVFRKALQEFRKNF